MTEPVATPPVVTPTLAGTTPLGWVAMAGLGGFGVLSTGLMLTCHLQLGYGQCGQARQDWGEQMTATGVGFGLLFTSSPGALALLLRRRGGGQTAVAGEPVAPWPEASDAAAEIPGPAPDTADRWVIGASPDPLPAPEPARRGWLPWNR